MASEQRDPLDRLLDEALSAYASREPRPGLERRVLNRVRAEGTRHRFPMLRWALPVAALGCALAAIGIWSYRAPVPAHPELARTEASPPRAIVAAAEPAKSPWKEQRSARRESAPKQPQFPIRRPLTHQERALMAFVRSAPDDALQAFGETLPTKIEPLRIDEIQLQPLQISDGSR